MAEAKKETIEKRRKSDKYADAIEWTIQIDKNTQRTIVKKDATDDDLDFVDKNVYFKKK